MASSPENPSDFTADAQRDAERARLLLRISKGVSRHMGTLHLLYKPGRAIAVAAPGLDYPVLIFAQSAGDDFLLRIGVCVAGNVDWQGTPGLADFLMRENAGLLLGRLQREDDALALEHHLFPTASAREVSIVAGAIADTAVRLHARLARVGALTVPEEEMD